MDNKDIDLEKLRDEKCVPVAQGMLADLAKDLIPENANEKIDYNAVITALQTRALDADLNVTMEVPYVFQILLGAFRGLNMAVQKSRFVEADDIRYGRIAKRILEILATSIASRNIPLVGLKPEQAEQAFMVISEDLQPLFDEEKLNWLEIKYLMDNILDAYKDVEGMFMQILNQGADTATAKAFGLADKTDLTLKKLDEVLKS